MPVEAQRTFRDSQRALILQALDATGWVIGGGSGSAARLGLKRTTLISKMKKFGISRPTRPSYANQPSDKRQNEQSDEQAGSAHLASSPGAHDDCQRRKKRMPALKKIHSLTPECRLRGVDIATRRRGLDTSSELAWPYPTGLSG